MAEPSLMIVDPSGNELPLEEEEELLPEEMPLVYSDDELNLVTSFKLVPKGVDALKKIADQVCEDFDKCWTATEQYRKRMADDWRIFSGDLPDKKYPFEHCANAHVPIMIENISRLTFRAYGEVFGNWDNVFNVLPVGPDDNDIAEVMTKHDNWQLRNIITDFPRQMHRMFLAFFSIGDVTCHSYFDPERNSNRHEVLTPDQFVIPFVYTTTQPDYSDVPFMVKIMHMERHQLQAMRKQWEDTDAVIRRMTPEYLGGAKANPGIKTKGKENHPSYDDSPEQELSDTVAQVTGVDKPDDARFAPYKILWFEGWLELPNQDRDRYVQVIIDPHTKTILKMTIHEQPDWQDQRRFDRQMAERDQYQMMLDQHAAMALHLTQQHQATVNDLGQAQDAVAVGREQGSFGPLQSQAMTESIDAMTPSEPMIPPPPPGPQWINDLEQSEDDPMGGLPLPKPVKRVPIRLFTHVVCIEPLVGSLGLGYGRIEADFTRAANVALSQFTDSATRANIKSFLTAAGIQMPQDATLAPGQFLEVPGVAPGDIQGAVMPLEFGPANPQLMEVVKLMSDMGQSAIQAPSVLSGESGKSGETFRGQQGRMDAATKQLSVVTGKLVDGLKQITKNNGALNAINLPEEQIVEVTNHITRTAQSLPVSRRFWERNYMVEFRSDLRFTSSATRIAEADNMMQIAGGLPMLQGNYAFIHAALKAMLDARGKAEFLPLIGAPPPPPQVFGVPTSPPAPPPGMMPPPGQGPPGQGGQPPQQGGPPQGQGGAGAPAPPSPGGQSMGPAAPGPANA